MVEKYSSSRTALHSYSLHETSWRFCRSFVNLKLSLCNHVCNVEREVEETKLDFYIFWRKQGVLLSMQMLLLDVRCSECLQECCCVVAKVFWKVDCSAVARVFVLNVVSYFTLFPQATLGIALYISFGWDVKPSSWLSVVIKNPMALLVKSRGVTPVSWSNSLHWPLSIMAS